MVHVWSGAVNLNGSHASVASTLHVSAKLPCLFGTGTVDDMYFFYFSSRTSRLFGGDESNHRFSQVYEGNGQRQ